MLAQAGIQPVLAEASIQPVLAEASIQQNNVRFQRSFMDWIPALDY